MLREERSPNGGLAVEYAASVNERFAQGAKERRGSVVEVSRVRNTFDDESKFIAAQPSSETVAATLDVAKTLQATGYGPKQGVTCIVTQGVVDLLEMIQIEHQQADVAVVQTGGRDCF